MLLTTALRLRQGLLVPCLRGQWPTQANLAASQRAGSAQQLSQYQPTTICIQHTMSHRACATHHAYQHRWMLGPLPCLGAVGSDAGMAQLPQPQESRCNTLAFAEWLWVPSCAVAAGARALSVTPWHSSGHSRAVPAMPRPMAVTKAAHNMQRKQRCDGKM
jgi:hypothetical protein